MTEVTLREWFGEELPNAKERVRLLREIGASLAASFGGQASNLVASAEGSASALVDLVTMHFPGFRDSTIYKGSQVGVPLFCVARFPHVCVGVLLQEGADFCG